MKTNKEKTNKHKPSSPGMVYQHPSTYIVLCLHTIRVSGLSVGDTMKDFPKKKDQIASRTVAASNRRHCLTLSIVLSFPSPLSTIGAPLPIALAFLLYARHPVPLNRTTCSPVVSIRLHMVTRGACDEWESLQSVKCCFISFFRCVFIMLFICYMLETTRSRYQFLAEWWAP